MNTYNIYIDESSIDNQKNYFMVIGAIFLKREIKDELKEKIKLIREENKIFTEIKWSKISKLNLDFLKKVIDVFFEYDENIIQFHSIVVDKRNVDYETYHNGDKELGFYKFMYQLLKQKLINEDNYYIFIDFKQTKVNDRLKKLNSFLDKGNIKHIQSYHSFDNIFIQIADLFTGAIGYSKNHFNKSIYKKEIISHIANKLGRNDLLFKSMPSEKKFYDGIDVKYPETGEKIGIYIGNANEVMHYISGKENTEINHSRAQKLLWIKFLIEEIELRDVFLEINNNNVLFVA